MNDDEDQGAAELAEGPEMNGGTQLAIPMPVIAGTFALYEDGRGGYVGVAETESHGVVRKAIPAALVRMLQGESGGPVGVMMRRMLGGRGGD